MIDELRDLAKSHDTYALAERIESGRDARAAAALYAELVRDLYWKAKDVRLVVIVGRAGILFSLTKAGEADSGSDAEAAIALRGLAKQMAYNVASFAWPGWDEPGITVADADRHAGHDAARLNLRLAVELKRDASKVAAAHWMLGAHELTAGQIADAAASFRRAKEQSEHAADAMMTLDYEAFLALSERLASPEDEMGRQSLDAMVDRVRAFPHADAKFFADQLVSVRQFFGV